MKDIKIFALSQSKLLGEKIANELGLKLGNLILDKFSDGEMSPGFEESIRSRKIFIIGSTHNSESIIELILTVDAARRSGAKQINLVVPYYGYARQDRKDKHRGAIGAGAIANIIESTGADTIMTIDLHASQIEGFFKMPVIHIQGKSVFIPFLKSFIDDSWVICSPDAGGVARASGFSKSLNLPFVVMNKRRDKPNSIASMELVGDVEGKKVLIIDDMVDTGGSLIKCSDILLEKGATSVSACISHGILSSNAIEKINNSNLTNLFISDTIPVENRIKEGKIKVFSSAPMLAKVISGISKKISVNQLTSDV
jgi:ribose-phosphate pyrophosphokinase